VVRLVYLGQTTAIKLRDEDVPVCVQVKARALDHLKRSVTRLAQKPPRVLIGAVMLMLSFEVSNWPPALQTTAAVGPTTG
jgi:hypothetical protein